MRELQVREGMSVGAEREKEEGVHWGARQEQCSGVHTHTLPLTHTHIFSTSLQAKQQQMLQDKRKQEEERLLGAISGDLGFHKGKPIAALVVFRWGGGARVKERKTQPLSRALTRSHTLRHTHTHSLSSLPLFLSLSLLLSDAYSLFLFPFLPPLPGVACSGGRSRPTAPRSLTTSSE
jgi:hypothetical protein